MQRCFTVRVFHIQSVKGPDTDQHQQINNSSRSIFARDLKVDLKVFFGAEEVGCGPSRWKMDVSARDDGVKYEESPG